MSRATKTSATPPRGGRSSRALYPKLHPGPGASAEEVASHQRARIYGAMIELVAQRGYSAVTVAEIARLAGVSTHTVYAHFEGKEECFQRAYDLLARRTAKRVEAAPQGCDEWRARMYLACRGWAAEIARDPQAARLALIEAYAGGPQALARMRRAEGIFVALIEQAFASAPDPVPVPALVVKGIVAGLGRVARARLLAGRERELPALAQELLEWALCFRCEAATAAGRLDGGPEGPSVREPPGIALLLSGADRENMDEDERARILEAAARLGAQDGYRRLTVPRIRAAAGVSRKTFDQHFEDVQDCFLAALQRLTTRALDYAAPEQAADRDWPRALHRSLHALCCYVAADPVYARLAFLEVLVPGPDGLRFRETMLTDISARLRASAPAGQRPSELSAEASVGASWEIVRQHVPTGHASRLPNLAGTLSFLVLAPAIGAQNATHAITVEHQQMHTSASARRVAPEALR